MKFEYDTVFWLCKYTHYYIYNKISTFFSLIIEQKVGDAEKNVYICRVVIYYY